VLVGLKGMDSVNLSIIEYGTIIPILLFNIGILILR